ncbi:b(0,+)-type amino acid transporter 1-like isoform X2 [Tubulanus polymorphus]|uniref:b(0,+)-type amino acid transporter 1-like isoform X2 n=1 Tax=Tubulanus polymorphus TaxID=672921 RepID=UPI003DA4D85E
MSRDLLGSEMAVDLPETGGRDNEGCNAESQNDINGGNGTRLRPFKSESEPMKNEELQSNEPIALKKEVGLISGVSLIVGTMIGSGIFISPTGVITKAGSVASSLCIWFGCGIISMLGSLVYAELGTLITKSGCEYAYLYDAFGPLHKFIGPIPAFLYSWISVIILDPSSFAVVALAFASYVSAPFFDDCGPPVFIVKSISITCILTVSSINAYSIRLAARVQVVFTIAKVIALIIIAVGGIVKMAQGNTQYLAEGFKDSSTNPTSIALAFYSGLWAYGGWNNLNFVTEEMKNPEKNLPRALMIAIPLVTVIYLLVNVSYFSVMSKEEVLGSTAVAVTWGKDVLGSFVWVIPLSVAMSTFGACNGSIFCRARLIFAAARKGHLMDILSMVHVKQLTPLPSLVFTTIIAIIMVIPGDIFTLIDFLSFTAWLFYGLTMIAFLVLRYTMKDVHRPYKCPIPIAVIMLLISLYLVIAPIVQDPQIELLYAFIFVIGGIIFYIPFVYFKLQIPGCVTTFLQLVMNCSTTSEKAE